MKLEGSCHCQAVHFTVESRHPYPFNLCYCSICRKTAGGGGYAINLGADHSTLQVRGKDKVSMYHARMPGRGRAARSPGERHFCSLCGSALRLWDPRWPELVHPFASAIDTPLPKPPERTHLLVGSKAPWVEVRADKQDKVFDENPDESLAEWHQRLDLEC